MTALAGGVSYPAVKFANPGDAVTGTVIDAADMPVTDFATKAAKTWPDGNPQIQTRVTLETTEGDTSTRVSLFVKPGRMMRAVREAITESGAEDIGQFGKLTMTFTHAEQGKGAQPAKCYTASYVPFDPTA